MYLQQGDEAEALGLYQKASLNSERHFRELLEAFDPSIDESEKLNLICNNS